MKKSELERIIREEIQSVLSEGPAASLLKKFFKKNRQADPKALAKIKGSKVNKKLPAFSAADLEKMNKGYEKKYEELDGLLDDALARQSTGPYDPDLEDYIDNLNYQMNQISDYRNQIGYGISTNITSPVIKKMPGQVKKSRE